MWNSNIKICRMAAVLLQRSQKGWDQIRWLRGLLLFLLCCSHLVLVVVLLVVIVLGIAHSGSLAAADGCQAAKHKAAAAPQHGDRNCSIPCCCSSGVRTLPRAGQTLTEHPEMYMSSALPYCKELSRPSGALLPATVGNPCSITAAHLGSTAASLLCISSMEAALAAATAKARHRTVRETFMVFAVPFTR